MMQSERWTRQQRYWEWRRARARRRRRQQILQRVLGFVFILSLIVFAAKGISGAAGAGKTVSTGGVKDSRIFSQIDMGDLSQIQKTSCIVLDPGHGGGDTGTLWGTVYEKDLNLAIAKKLKKKLVAQGYSVFMTREEDVRVSLQERVDFAEDCRADIFVSIHQNALENDTVTGGIQVYGNESACAGTRELATSIHVCLLEETGAVDRGLSLDSDLFVNKNAKMPSCLVETGFLTCGAEREKLLSEEYQEQLADGILKGILQYLREVS